MNIKKVSELTGVSADTIRYYERIGLIPPVTRNQSGVRNFSDRDISVLEFVRYFRGAGVSVESLIDYIGLVEQGDSTIGARLAILQEEKEKLEERVSKLQAALDRLNHKIDNYQNKVVPREHQLFDQKESES
ncbi:stress response transcriptional regulator NmlR [Streptococcus uberis]|uniref:stress response transcriptional regulator NmlR n=1 Tax=Streptococcus uberis TaxID=1349 RepID=UPI001C94D702|nr:stress response transcriptional regulator NmlR [Streptococcus uberis]MBY4764436.1 MerR family transcriptional regulator [Streptococcus uberis]MCK1158987.1 MerR family transcriptional regulator [Streptococcus uberis]MCK1160768.1 MerR family transcriptional regulator [Streptococcus uberis]MCK1164546.1 MerR family transcriptional regulator [Streptococcus uberis]MCK1187146.1 MerR family transcriptional regulator [Streptococcus uberis]